MNSTVKMGAWTDSRVSFSVQFWILLTISLISLICSFIVIYRYLSIPSKRAALHNHSILLLIILNVIFIFTDVAWMLDAFRHSGTVSFHTPAFCLIWWFFDFALYSIQTNILAWASIERHILIFHSRYVNTRKQRLLYHYLPPLVLIIYLILFHLGVFFFPSCENEFHYNQTECGIHPCYLDLDFLAIWDKLLHHIIPTFVIAFSNIALLYRIIAQKKRLRRPIQWKKHRRMAIQLLSISAVYVFVNLPTMIFIIVELLHNIKTYETNLYVFISTYLVSFSFSIVICCNYISIDKHRHIRISPTVSLIQNRRTATRISQNLD